MEDISWQEVTLIIVTYKEGSDDLVGMSAKKKKMDGCLPRVLTRWSYLSEWTNVQDLACAGWTQEGCPLPVTMNYGQFINLPWRMFFYRQEIKLLQSRASSAREQSRWATGRLMSRHPPNTKGIKTEKSFESWVFMVMVKPQQVSNTHRSKYPCSKTTTLLCTYPFLPKRQNAIY